MLFSKRFLILILVLSFILALVALVQYGQLSSTQLVAALPALASSFFGALFAFRLTLGKERQLKQEKQQEDLNSAIFILIRQLNAVNSLKQEIEPFRLLNSAAFSCPALVPPTYQDLSIKFEDLGFLHRFDGTNLLFRLAVEQAGFRQVIAGVELRSKRHVEQLQPKLSELYKSGDTISTATLRAELGDALFCSTQNEWKYMVENIDKAGNSIPILSEELFKLAKKVFPEERFLKL